MPVNKETPIIELERIHVAYGDQMVLEDITFDIYAGEYLGVIGPNGGGKTTLLRVILGLQTPTSGTVKLFGEPLAASRQRYRIGYVPQSASAHDDVAFPATVNEIVASGRTARRGLFHPMTAADRAAIKEAMATAGVTALGERRIGGLSGGERQRVMIARALASEPSVLILDEPTTAVDAPSQEAFYEFLTGLHKKNGLTVILVSHDLDVVAHEVERILCLNRHMMCHGPTAMVLRETTLTNLYGKNPPVIHHGHPDVGEHEHAHDHPHHDHAL